MNKSQQMGCLMCLLGIWFRISIDYAVNSILGGCYYVFSFLLFWFGILVIVIPFVGQSKNKK